MPARGRGGSAKGRKEGAVEERRRRGGMRCCGSHLPGKAADKELSVGGVDTMVRVDG